MSTEEQLREALRLSKLIQGLPVKEKSHVLGEEDLKAIADAVVEKVKDVLLLEMGRMLWDVIRKAVITWAVVIFVIDQVKVWLR